MSKIINFDNQSLEEMNKAYDLWSQKVKDQILGKTISFTGMQWKRVCPGWESFTVKVQKVHPNTSGNPFWSEIDILGEDGESYTIHSEYDLTIID